jgi:ubiquinone/menaquinone biosynthesis C-methylase UbiE
MLRIARAKLADRGIAAELVQGDFTALPLNTQAVDTVVMHQVLHFAHEPDRVIAEVARVLRPGGHLLIADFAPHEQEDLRIQAAHARLGFSDAQIGGWFAANGLVLESREALAGDPLTVMLWLARREGEAQRMAA